MTERARLILAWVQILTLVLTATLLIRGAVIAYDDPTLRKTAAAFGVLFAVIAGWKMHRVKKQFPQWH